MASLITDIDNLALEKGDRIHLQKKTDSFTILEKNTRSFLKPICLREQLLGNEQPEFSDLIWNWFQFRNQAVLFPKPQEISLYCLLKPISNQGLFAAGESLRVKYVGTWVEALSMISESILTSKVDEDNDEILAYFSHTYGTEVNTFLFRAKRINRRIWIFFEVFIPEQIQQKGAKVCFKTHSD